MSGKLLRLLVIACLLVAFSSSVSYAGIYPSPWQPTRIQMINTIKARIQPLTTTGDYSVAIKAQGIIDHLTSIRNRTTLEELAVRTINVTYRITAVLFDPQPEPPAFDPLLALNAIDEFITMGFDTRDNVSYQALMAVNILGRITNGLFDPQPEPPAMQAFLNIMYGISSLVVNTEFGYETQLMMEMRVFNKMTAVLFDPQPEPPASGMNMFDIIDEMEILHDPHGP